MGKNYVVLYFEKIKKLLYYKEKSNGIKSSLKTISKRSHCENTLITNKILRGYN